MVAVFTVLGVSAALYPGTLDWLASYKQSKALLTYPEAVDRSLPQASEQLEMAHEYNRTIWAETELRAEENVPIIATSPPDSNPAYEDILSADGYGLMARLRVPKIDLDVPVYHGRSQSTLLRGAGHLKGSDFPVGGAGTHAVITGYKEVVGADTFQNLNRVKAGDTFSIIIYGEVLSYKVNQTSVLTPGESDILTPEPGRDLVTLVTSAPQGAVKSRVVVTGERIVPTPAEDTAAAALAPEGPSFPYWILVFAGGVGLAAIYVWWSGYADMRPRRVRALKRGRNEEMGSGVRAPSKSRQARGRTGMSGLGTQAPPNSNPPKRPEPKWNTIIEGEESHTEPTGDQARYTVIKQPGAGDDEEIIHYGPWGK